MENLLYIPLAFACWLSPVIGLFYAATGLFSPKISEEEAEAAKTESEIMHTDEAVAGSTV